MVERTGHYDILFAKARSLLGAYDNLRQLTELFEGATGVEKYMAEAEEKKAQINRTIKSLEMHKEELSHRCQDEADKIKGQKKVAEDEVILMAKKYTDRYEAEHGKMVKEAEQKVVDAEHKLFKLDQDISGKLHKQQKLNESIQLQESQRDTLNAQFKKIQESLTVGG